MSPKPRRVGIYTRISLDRDGNAPAPARQLADCTELVEQRGWIVAGVYTDRDESAYSTKAKRPEYQRMLVDLEAGVIDAVCVWKLDRLGRRMNETNRVVARIDELGASLLSVHDAGLDTSMAMGKAIIGFIAAQAETESANTAARVKRAREQEISEGRMPFGGRRCFGYTLAGEVDEDEAAWLRKAAAWYLDGVAYREIARRLNVACVTTTTGGQWVTATLRTLLLSPRIGGYRKSADGKTLVRGNWIPILDDTTYKALHVEMTKGKKPARRASGAVHLLTGLAFCGRCGGKLTVVRYTTAHGKVAPRLTCARNPGEVNCGKLAVTEAPLDRVVAQRFVDRLNRTPLLPTVDVKKLNRQLAADRQAMADATNARYIERTIDDDQFAMVQAKLTARIEEAERSLDNSLFRGVTLTTKALSEAARSTTAEGTWKAADLAGKRSLLRSQIERVVVHPATRLSNVFDESRVEIVWR